MKNLDFQDYHATITDADGDEHVSTVRAAVVRDEHVYITDSETGNRTRREAMTIAGNRQLQSGDVLVETATPNLFDFITGEQWAKTGYALEGSESDSEEVSEPETEDDSEADSETEAEPVKPVKKTAAKRTLPANVGG